CAGGGAMAGVTKHRAELIPGPSRITACSRRSTREMAVVRRLVRPTGGAGRGGPPRVGDSVRMLAWTRRRCRGTRHACLAAVRDNAVAAAGRQVSGAWKSWRPGWAVGAFELGCGGEDHSPLFKLLGGPASVDTIVNPRASRGSQGPAAVTVCQSATARCQGQER